MRGGREGSRAPVTGYAAAMLPLLAPLLLLAQKASAPAPDDWPHWRGPTANGVAGGPAPRSFGDGEHVRWRVEIPGRGMSTPILLGERVFVTTAVPREASAASAGTAAPEEQSFEVHCLERASGKTLWRSVARVALPHEGYHASYGSYASASPVTDGERLYVSFGSQGVYAYELDGTLAWSFDPGVKLAMRNGFGEGLAPVLAGDVLVQVADQEHDSFVFALDTRTGKELWRVPRDEPSGWSTPLVTSFEGQAEVVTTGARRTRSYAPTTGALLWEGQGAGLNAIPNVLRHENLVLVMSGFREARILALEPPHGAEADGASADESPREAEVRWSAAKGCGYTASAVLCDGLFYSVTDRGTLSCTDAATGEAHYVEERLPRGSTLKSSPVAAGGLLYVPTEAGEVHLVRLGPTYELVGTMTFADQTFVASPAVSRGALWLRSLTQLICLAE